MRISIVRMPRHLKLLLFSSGILLLASQAAMAHSPSDMMLSYDPSSRILSVMRSHPIPDPNSHYIREVTVQVSGQPRLSTQYSRQPSGTSFTYTYSLDVAPGDSIEVSATCSRGGSLTRSLATGGNGVSGASPGAASLAPTRAAFPAQYIILLLSLVIFWRGR